MSLDILIALAAFAFVSSITPGPNNIMLMASGANFGLRRTVPHMLGVAVGFMVMLVLAGMGLAGLFDLWPPAHQVMKGLGIGYMLWLAWKVATAAPPEPGADPGRPLTFLQAAAFQWVNPKALAMALTAVTVYAPGREPLALIWVALVFGMINLPSVGTWVLMGRGMTRALADPRRLRLFNRAMALALVASMVAVI